MVSAHISSFLTLHIWAEDDSCRRGLWLRCCLSIFVMARLGECDTPGSAQGSDLSVLEYERPVRHALLNRFQERNLVLTFGKCSFQWWLFSRERVEGIRSCRSPNTLSGHSNKKYWRIILVINCYVQWMPKWLTCDCTVLLNGTHCCLLLLLEVIYYYEFIPHTSLSNKTAFVFLFVFLPPAPHLLLFTLLIGCRLTLFLWNINP